MTETDMQRGNLIAFLNHTKTAEDERPAFVGKLTLPGTVAERGFALWPSTSKSGDTFFSGRAGESAAAQIERLANPEKVADPEAAIRVAEVEGKGLDIEPHAMVLFTNKQKDTAHPGRPDYFGYYNPGSGNALMRVAVWARTDARGRAMLAGNLQPNDLNVVPGMDQGAIGMPSKRKRRAMSM